MSEQDLLERIATNPKIMLGKPTIKGTRLTVEYILNRFAHGTTMPELLDEYQGLAPDDIYACFLFANRTLADTVFMPLAMDMA